VSLKLKTLAILREFRRGMDIQDYLVNELRQNWKALDLFIQDAGEAEARLTETIENLQNEVTEAGTIQRTTVAIALSSASNPASFTTAATIAFTSTKTRIRAILSPATSTPPNTVYPSLQHFPSTAGSVDGHYIKIVNSTTSEVVYQGRFLNIPYTSSPIGFYHSPVLMGEIDVVPGVENTFIVQHRPNSGAFTCNIALYNFTIEEL